jgi:hypothetical protein
VTGFVAAREVAANRAAADRIRSVVVDMEIVYKKTLD